MKCVLEGGVPDRLPVQPICMTFAARQFGVKYGRYCRDWKTLADCQLRLAERFDLDVLSLVSDPMREAADCGAPVSWFEDQPPSHAPGDVVLEHKRDLLHLQMPDPLGGGRMYDRVVAADHLASQAAGRIPILGWIEGPLAEAADLRGLNTLLVDIVDDPGWVNDLLGFCTDLAIEFALAQAPFVDVMGIGDAACSLVGPNVYEGLVLPHQKRIVEALRAAGLSVRMHICGRIDHLYRSLATLGADIVDVDYPSDLAAARQALGPTTCLIGNLNPVDEVRNALPVEVSAGLQRCFAETGMPFIVGAGCEIPPDTPDANVRAMVEFGTLAAGQL